MATIGMGLYLLLLSGFDMKEKKVPIILLVVGLIIVVGIKTEYILFGGDKGMMNITAPLLGCVPGLFFLGLGKITKAVGLGDGMILLILGILVGYGQMIILLTISLLLQAVVSVLLLGLKKVNLKTGIPFIPFLTGGYLLWSICC